MGELFGTPDNKKCCNCGGFCPCCPGWPQAASATVTWTSTSESSDCGPGSTIVQGVTNLSCEVGTEPDSVGTLLRSEGVFLLVRLYCDAETQQFKIQYRSAISGGTLETPVSEVWADAIEATFECPVCANAVDGVVTTSVDFIALQACETSGGVVTYEILVHGDVEVPCP